MNAALPGEDLIETGLHDPRERRETVAALVVAIGAPRLRRLGLEIDSPPFTDLLVITEIPEGCPGSDDQDHPIVYHSEQDGNPEDYLERPLAARAEGSLMQPMVGPFPVRSYRLTVTLAKDLSNTTSYSCIDVVPS
ncbi:MAG: hypothetical protein C3F12_08545 [Candidatus Methylomirabilota bacterium]|nr:hypothetical protein [Candidatus Methylomirabilis sp.]PWB46100.1 MAG: hypothetical protein C3F12_08545 [candidate division NC10 bacterium]